MRTCKKSTTTSLRRSLTKRLVFLTIVMSVMCIGVLLWSRIDYFDLQQILSFSSRINAYLYTIGEVNASINEYGSTLDEMYLAETSDKMTELLQYADSLRAFSHIPVFEDQYQMTQSLQDKLSDFLTVAVSPKGKDNLALLSEVKYIISLLQNNENNVANSVRIVTDSQTESVNRNHVARFVLVCFVIICIFVLCILWGIYLAKKTVKPIESLAERIETAKIRFPEFSKEMQGTNVAVYEISVLSNTFDSMLRKIQEQILETNENMQLTARLKELELHKMRTDKLLIESELRAIQGLIHPHFLYNCLNVVSGLACMEDAPRAHEATHKIAVYLRESIDNIGKIITMRYEIERIYKYIDLQKLRFFDRIAYHIECDEESLNATLPAMTLQPIVENSIVHGLCDCEEGGIIDIKIKAKNSMIQIQVADNGVGMSDDVIQDIYTFFRKPQAYTGSIGIGLKSVLMQLKIFFSDNVQLLIQSTPSQSCSITIQVPLTRNS